MDENKKDQEEKLVYFIRYDGEVFIHITDENFKKVIRDVCLTIYNNNLHPEESTDDEDEPVLMPSSSIKKREYDIAVKYMEELENLLELLPRPYTIVQEDYYIDRSYRDTYYTYFSNQHFDTKRYSRRLSLISGKVTWEAFFSENGNDLAQRYMGACVINPLSVGVIGRTLINPCFILANKPGQATLPVHVRLSNFTLHVYGQKFLVSAFPYRMQDGETMRCTEVTLLNLIEYYSNSYQDYRNATPSEILGNEQKHNYERVLPSRGINYQMLSKVLYDFGFSPRLYNASEIKQYPLSKMTREDELKRLLYYYIESGIPVALNLQPKIGNDVGHSIVCIGHGHKNPSLSNKAKSNKRMNWRDNACNPLIDAAVYCDEFVVIDDNQPVYQVRQFDRLYPDMKAASIAVPLYKRMFLDASDATAIMRAILHHEQLGIAKWAGGFVQKGEDVVIRMFMASSHSLKDFRGKTLKGLKVREAYVLVPMPRFVWVCEIYRECDYDGTKDSMAFGEIVIDATSTADVENAPRSIIIMHYPRVLGMRFPNQPQSEIDDRIEFDEDGKFPAFNKNLESVEPIIS